jgi:hypothetical protein
VLNLQNFLAILLCVACLAYGAEIETGSQLKSLATQLGSENYDERVHAQIALANAHDKAQPALEAIESSADYETQLRARRLLRSIYAGQKRSAEWAWLGQNLCPLFGCHDYAWRGAAEPEDTSSQPETNNASYHLSWLAQNQEPDGHWDSMKHGAQTNADIEQTSLALLAFLGAGHSEKVGEHHLKVKLAVEWLSRHVQESGAILASGEKEPHGTAQALAGMALAEASGMAGIQTTKDVAQRVINYSSNEFQCEANSERSGFGMYAKSLTPDLVTTTLFTMALKSAKVSKLNVPGIAFDGIIRFLDAVELKNAPATSDIPVASDYAFVPGGKASPRAAIMGCLCRQFLGWKREELTPTFANAIDDYGCYCAETSDDLSDWIAGIVAFHQRGRFLEDFENIYHPYPGQMRRDGKNRGSWDPRGEWSGAGRVFSTSLRVLSLEIYYRYSLQ